MSVIIAKPNAMNEVSPQNIKPNTINTKIIPVTKRKVSIIPADFQTAEAQPKVKRLRTCAYCRVSTDSE